MTRPQVLSALPGLLQANPHNRNLFAKLTMGEVDAWGSVLREVLDSRQKSIDDEIITYCASLVCDAENASSQAVNAVIGELLQVDRTRGSYR